jgi:hypothetical protein
MPEFPAPALPQQTTSSFRKYIPVIFFISAAITLLIAIIILNFLPSQPETPSLTELPEINSPIPQPSITPVKDQKSTFKKISFVGTAPVLPEYVALYSSQPIPNVTQLAQKVATTLQLTPFENSGKAWVSPDGQSVLSIGEDTNTLTFTNGSMQDVNPTEAPNEGAFSRRALKDAVDLGLILDNQPFLKTSISFYDNSPEPTTVIAENAQNIEVAFTILLNDIPAFTDAHMPLVLYLWYTPDKVLTKILGMPLSFSITPQSKTKPLTTNQAIANITKGIYVVSKEFAVFGNFKNISDFDEVTFDEVSLEYLFSREKLMFFPYYRFSGEGWKDSEENTYGIEVLTPAVPAY